MGSSCPVVTKQDEHQKTYHCFLAPRLPNNEMLCFSTVYHDAQRPIEAARFTVDGAGDTSMVPTKNVI